MARISNSIFGSLDWFQTGYAYDVSNHQLCLAELMADYVSWFRIFFALFADFIRAFPRSWRAAILVAVHAVAGVADGAFALLASIMEYDIWKVLISGLCRVILKQGVPEGSAYAPSVFNLLPDGLIKQLRASG